MYNPNSNPNRRRAPDADTPPLGVFYQRRTYPNRRLERHAADDAVVNTTHWG